MVNVIMTFPVELDEHGQVLVFVSANAGTFGDFEDGTVFTKQTFIIIFYK